MYRLLQSKPTGCYLSDVISHHDAFSKNISLMRKSSSSATRFIESLGQSLRSHNFCQLFSKCFLGQNTDNSHFSQSFHKKKCCCFGQSLNHKKSCFFLGQSLHQKSRFSFRQSLHSNHVVQGFHSFPSWKAEQRNQKNSHSTESIEDDLKDHYIPGNSQDASKDVVFRAMIGNMIITTIKFGAWAKTGSSAMLSEAIHSLVDTGNQGLLVFGLQQASGVPDKRHQYGYGRAAYVWSLISALGMFWLGAGVTIAHGIDTLFHPPASLHFSWEIWCVLGASFAIDGYVLQKATKEIFKNKPKGVGYLEHIKKVKNPFMMAVFLEDASACIGVIMAIAGIGSTYITGNLIYDSLASISIGCLLGSVAISLVRLNQRFLLGQSVDPDIELGIKNLLLQRPAIDNVYSVQSQWVGPSAFSYKAEVDFDGTYLAASLLESYKPVFFGSTDLQKDLSLILAWYAEDVTRLVEKEVKEVEAEIRALYPEAAFIELEPDSKDTNLRAIADFERKSVRKVEREAMDRALSELARTLERSQHLVKKKD